MYKIIKTMHNQTLAVIAGAKCKGLPSPHTIPYGASGCWLNLTNDVYVTST